MISRIMAALWVTLIIGVAFSGCGPEADSDMGPEEVVQKYFQYV